MSIFILLDDCTLVASWVDFSVPLVSVAMLMDCVETWKVLETVNYLNEARYGETPN